MDRRYRVHAFTLIEILICVGIIALLLGLTTLAVASAWRRANAARCLSNLHQISVVIADLRANSRNGSDIGVISNRTWHLRCPSDPAPAPDFRDDNKNYTYNSMLPGKAAEIPSPAGTAEVLELQDGVTNLSAGPACLPTPENLRMIVDTTRLGSSANYLFADGHAEPIAWLTIQKTYNATHNFFNPKAGC